MVINHTYLMPYLLKVRLGVLAMPTFRLYVSLKTSLGNCRYRLFHP